MILPTTATIARVAPYRLLDHHAHSAEFSFDATVPMRDLVLSVSGMGIGPALSDHWPAQGNMSDLPGLNAYIDSVEQLRAETSLPILRGVEIFAGRPSNVVDPTTLARLDHVVLGLHRYPCAPDADRRAWLDSILDLLEVEFSRQPVDILAHATREPDKYGFPPDNLPLAWQDRLVEILLRFGVALEINGKSQHPHEGLLRRARAAGVQLSFGSDVHHEAQIHNAVEYCETVVRHLGLTQDDLFDARAPKHLRRSAESWARVG